MDIHTLSRLGRFKDIAVTLVSYGFGDLISRLDLPERILRLSPKKSQYTHLDAWKRLRLVITELGPTFIKFGQLLSLRSDLLPLELTAELSKLQDDVPPEAFEDIKKRIEKELEAPLETVFADFETTPIAAASLAQVHRALLKKDRSVVAVKVQRPGIQRTITYDLDILAGLARQLHERVETLSVYNLPQLIQELRRLMFQELDFEREARNMRLARANFKDEDYLSLPAVFNDYSTSRVLCMELIQGTMLKDLMRLPFEDRKALAQTGIRAALKQILEDGFFHADPHPGNIIIQNNKVLTLLDWGMVGRITPNTRGKLITLLEAVVDRDSEIVLNMLLLFSHHSNHIKRDQLQRDIMDILDDYYSVPLSEINIGQLLNSLTNLLFEHKIRMKSDLAIMVRAIVASEGTARLLYPELNVVAEAEPYLKKIALEKLSPAALKRKIRKEFSKFIQLNREVPLRFNQILGKMENDQLSIGFEHRNLDGLRNTLDRVANRITLALLTAALIIGSSMIITTGVRPLLFGYPALGLIGFLLSGCIGLWLIIDILRKRKR
ncbi:MAG: AarF/ABC1/UbiB kinase family protein [Desulfohalobiaceae bacterium]|nr:AarF/ABC1/UbiB kinase family protein [Desulfohalobiaceae bacterium]